MDLSVKIAAAAARLAGGIKWVALPEKLAEPEAAAAKGAARRPFWRWLLLPEGTPSDAARAAAPAKGLLRFIFEAEPLGREEPPADGAAPRPGFVKNLLAFESLPREETEAPRRPSLLRWLASPEELEAPAAKAREGKIKTDKEG
ncbi:MAG TPA: hypothetical protein VM658_09820 [bacterium]|nr:hypothetical protein [bacterium]